MPRPFIDYGRLKAAIKDAIKEGVSTTENPIPAYMPELAKKVPGTDKLDARGLNHIFTAAVEHYDNNGNYLYTENDVDLSNYWTQSALTLPPNTNYLTILSKIPIKYGYIAVYAKLPNWDGQGYDNGSTVQFGFGLGKNPLRGFVGWDFERDTSMAPGKYGTNYLYTFINNHDLTMLASEQTNTLPEDYSTTVHTYWVKVNKHQVWLGIDDKIRTFIILANVGTATKMYYNTPPYSIFIAPYYIPEAMFSLIRLVATKGGKPSGASVEFGWSDVRIAEGDPQPPLAMSLYLEGNDRELAHTYISSGSVTSHAVPTFGYENKLIYFQSSGAGTLTIEMSTLYGMWGTYDSISVPAGTLIKYKINDPVPLIRVTFTPQTYPTTINEANIVMF